MNGAYNPYFDPSNRPLGPKRIRFSAVEVQHLAGAVTMLTLGFAIAGSGTISQRLNQLLAEPMVLVAAFLAVSSGFVLHELAHKIVAIRYGCLAEFRAQMSGLGISVLIATFLGFLFAAPGAVQVYGRVDTKENGIISLVGPATNLTIAILLLPLVLLWPDRTEVGAMVVHTVAGVNAWLGAFNMLPFGPLDGRKVMVWNKAIWAIGLAGAIGLSVFIAVVPRLAL